MPRLVLDRDPDSPSRGLRALDVWLQGLSPGLADRVRLAAGEAIGNAVEHGEAYEIVLEWTASGPGGTLCVDDASHLSAVQFEQATLPADIATHGRGLYILSQVSDGVRVRSGHGLCLDFVPRATD